MSDSFLNFVYPPGNAKYRIHGHIFFPDEQESISVETPYYYHPISKSRGNLGSTTEDAINIHTDESPKLEDISVSPKPTQICLSLFWNK